MYEEQEERDIEMQQGHDGANSINITGTNMLHHVWYRNSVDYL